jgi:hypothetical protein
VNQAVIGDHVEQHRNRRDAGRHHQSAPRKETEQVTRVAAEHFGDAQKPQRRRPHPRSGQAARRPEASLERPVQASNHHAPKDHHLQQQHDSRELSPDDQPVKPSTAGEGDQDALHREHRAEDKRAREGAADEMSDHGADEACLVLAHQRPVQDGDRDAHQQ